MFRVCCLLLLFAALVAAFRTPATLLCGVGGAGNKCGSATRKLPHSRPRVAWHSSMDLVPSWEELNTLLPTAAKPETALLTFFRDNNGWSSAAARVWIALLVKGIPFESRTVNILGGDREWYRKIVPEGTVPAIQIHASGEVVLDSAKILERLEDEEFAAFPPLIPSAEAERATTLMEKCVTGDFMGELLFDAGLNSTEDLRLVGEKFCSAVDHLDALLGESASDFFLDSGFSAVDCLYVPILERFAVQVPSKLPINLRDQQRWPHLARWFASVESQVPLYTEQVKGDEYSWLSRFSEPPMASRLSLSHPDRLSAVRSQAADALASLMAAPLQQSSPAGRQQAAAALLRNHQAVVGDLVGEARSQKHLRRLPPSAAPAADQALRRCSALLLGAAPSATLSGVTEEEGRAAELVAARLCVPRDMGACAAAALRSALGDVASQARRPAPAPDDSDD